MGVEYFKVTLQVYRYVGGPPPADQFLGRLLVSPEDGAVKVKKPRPRVDLVEVESAAFQEAEEPNEAFVAELDRRLKRVAGWLERQPATLFAELRDAGFCTQLLFTGWIDCDQLDLDLPPELLRICGELGLSISIITND